jgi:hypothetical protein
MISYHRVYDCFGDCADDSFIKHVCYYETHKVDRINQQQDIKLNVPKCILATLFSFHNKTLPN